MITGPEISVGTSAETQLVSSAFSSSAGPALPVVVVVRADADDDDDGSDLIRR